MTRHFSQYDLASRWKLSHRTLERWRWEGIGPAHLKIGRSVRYRLEDIEEYEKSRLVSHGHVQMVSKNKGQNEAESKIPYIP